MFFSEKGNNFIGMQTRPSINGDSFDISVQLPLHLPSNFNSKKDDVENKQNLSEKSVNACSISPKLCNLWQNVTKLVRPKIEK